MGCVLSPSRAKLLVNSVVAAIHLTVCGVRLWGAAPVTQGSIGAGSTSSAFAWTCVSQPENVSFTVSFNKPILGGPAVKAHGG